MDIQTRKLEFIQEFLKIQSEELISLLERILKSNETTSVPFTAEELMTRVKESEENYKAGKFKSQDELEKLSENW
ncbi:MAG: hypothetical protein L6264_11210 [Weeksellaceae bacterium]|nr:hypothetical protein [Bacteroidota bacterium]MCG2781505.1 hypothetical protein [Weeksellaceae bacterium]